MQINPEAVSYKRANKISLRTGISLRMSTWVVMGFVFWVGFFIGAVILHAMVK